MPESPLPPAWGPAYDERDLDALLSGETASLPGALLPLAGTLAALNAGPVRAEMAGEAAARAAFRQFMGDRAAWAEGAEHGTVTPRTLVLPGQQPDGPQRQTPRHRHRAAGGALRQPASGGFRRRAVIVGAAAAVALVVGAGLGGLLPGSVGSAFRLPFGPTPVPAGTGQPSAPQVDASGTPEPSPEYRPTLPANSGGTGAATDHGALCRQYYSFFQSPEPKSESARATEKTDFAKLEKLAKGPWNVLSYCLPSLDDGPWAKGQNAGNASGTQQGNSSQNGSGSGPQTHGHPGGQGGSAARQPSGQANQG